MHLMLLIAGGIILAVVALMFAPTIIGAVIYIVALPISWIAGLCYWISKLFKRKTD